jgi:hypothetical protein
LVLPTLIGRKVGLLLVQVGQMKTVTGRIKSKIARIETRLFIGSPVVGTGASSDETLASNAPSRTEFRLNPAEVAIFSAKTARNLHFAETLVRECDI